MATDLWMQVFSMQRWTDPGLWEDVLRTLEEVLGEPLERLDESDPIRRKAIGNAEDAAYIVSFGPKEDSRVILGKFKKTGVSLEVTIYKNGADTFGRLRDNVLRLVIPPRNAGRISSDDLKHLFLELVNRLQPYYGYADRIENLRDKRFAALSWDPSRELLGVFWLTYFGPAYSKFFTIEKMQSIDGFARVEHGAILELGESADTVDVGARETAESVLGALSFARSERVEKAPGEYAIQLQDLV